MTRFVIASHPLSIGMEFRTRDLSTIGRKGRRRRTPYERRNPKVMDAKRKRRVAAGSGTKVEEINRLLKMHMQMATMMKQMGQGKGLLGKMMGGKGAPDAAELEKMQAELAAMDPNAIPADLKDMMQGGALPEMPKSLLGLGGGLPGLGGGNPFKGFPGLPGKKR